MSNIESYLDALLEHDKHMREAQKLFSSGPLSHSVEQMVDCYRSMFDRFCPFKVDDRVQLKNTPNIDASSGRSHCRHFLIKGASGYVSSRDYRNGKFVFYVVFDDESWIDLDGKERPVEPEQRHSFNFTESSLSHE